MAPRSGLAAGLGVITGVAALAAGGIALGIELERRIVAKRITRTSEAIWGRSSRSGPMGLMSPRRTASCCTPKSMRVPMTI
jgi:hypothetical protein